MVDQKQSLSESAVPEADVQNLNETDAAVCEAAAAEPAETEETEASEPQSAEPAAEPAAETAEGDTAEPDLEEAELEADKFAGKSKAELLALLETSVAEQPVLSLRQEVEAVKVAFYKLHKSDVEAARRAFLEEGGDEAEFVPPVDDAEVRLKDILREYRRRRDEYTADLDRVKEENYKTKLSIIDELKELVDTDETLNHTFAKFRELQQRWKETGPVPQQYVKDMWETYNLHVENFYNFIKINKDLRDLDLKKNLEIKEALCADAEALAGEKSVVDAFHRLQKLHDEWRETGPVAKEFKDALWERFKAASTVINKRHQEYFEGLKEEQMHNLELKNALCEEAEALAADVPSTLKAWNKMSQKLLDIQTRWKGIGFAPRKENNKIYERFRAACDKFFESKRVFYAGLRDEMGENLRRKTEICEAAEALCESTDWKEATDGIIKLQADWKTVGAVSRRHSDAIWKRFRAACDKFFTRKAEHFASVDSEYEVNLEAKRALLAEMQAADVEAGGYDVIKDFQRRWNEIGFVPIKAKNALQKQYKEALDKLFAVLRGSEQNRSMNRFREKVTAMAASGGKRLRTERDRLYGKVRQLEQDIAVLENNIGFFSTSKGAEKLIADVNEKIERAKRELAETIEKVNLIDENAEKGE